MNINISCLICTDSFNDLSEVYVTPCGHLFHHSCLQRWIGRSETCPQCRSTVTLHNIIRVFLDGYTLEKYREHSAPNIALLARIDSLEFQLMVLNKRLKARLEKNAQIEVENTRLRQKNIKCEFNLRVLNEEANDLREKAAERDRLQREVIRLKRDLGMLEDVIINGSEKQVEEMLKHNNDVKLLSLSVVKLKKALAECEQEKQVLQTVMKSMKRPLTFKDEIPKKRARQ